MPKHLQTLLLFKERMRRGDEIALTCEVQQLLGGPLCSSYLNECYRRVNAWNGCSGTQVIHLLFQ